MSSLAKDLLGAKGISFDSLLKSESEPTKRFLHRLLGQQLVGNGPILDNAFDQLLAIMAMANFSESLEECTQVARILCVYIPDAEPLISHHRGFDLGGRCLVALSLFYPWMQKRWQRGYPSPDYYRLVGKSALHQSGREDISSHFENWEMYINEQLVIQEKL